MRGRKSILNLFSGLNFRAKQSEPTVLQKPRLIPPSRVSLANLGPLVCSDSLQRASVFKPDLFLL